MLVMRGVPKFAIFLAVILIGWSIYDAGTHFGPWKPEVTRLQKTDVVTLVEMNLKEQIQDLSGKASNGSITKEEMGYIMAELITRNNALSDRENWRIYYKNGIWTVYAGILKWYINDRIVSVDGPGYQSS